MKQGHPKNEQAGNPDKNALSAAPARQSCRDNQSGFVSPAEKPIAVDFVDKYPITEFMTQQEIDYSAAVVRSDVTVNVVMIGFENTNHGIFLTAVATDQLMTKIDGKLVEKPINYWIYDKNDAAKKLLDGYHRYSAVLKGETSKYLPLPPKPANETFLELDPGDAMFYQSLQKNLSAAAGMHPYNYIIIAFGTDEQNIALANNIIAKLKQWNLAGYTKVFVKTKNKAPNGGGFIAFGVENEEAANNHLHSANEKIAAMALDRYLIYAAAGAQVKREHAIKKWFAQTPMQRRSNAYACLGIRMKLHMLGFDYRPINDCADAAGDAFQRAYEEGDKIAFKDSPLDGGGKKTVLYTNNYVSGSIRQTFAKQEHQRWNAYMISCGFVPSTIEQIKANDGKNMAERRHGNITTFDGLAECRRIESEITGKSQEETDVIRYDYQLMDGIVGILARNGYKIVRK